MGRGAGRGGQWGGMIERKRDRRGAGGGEERERGRVGTETETETGTEKYRDIRTDRQAEKE